MNRKKLRNNINQMMVFFLVENLSCPLIITIFLDLFLGCEWVRDIIIIWQLKLAGLVHNQTYCLKRNQAKS